VYYISEDGTNVPDADASIILKMSKNILSKTKFTKSSTPIPEGGAKTDGDLIDTHEALTLIHDAGGIDKLSYSELRRVAGLFGMEVKGMPKKDDLIKLVTEEVRILSESNE
jgi:hypothetical protein